MSLNRLILDKDPEQAHKMKLRMPLPDGVQQVRPQEPRDAAGGHGRSSDSSNHKHQSSLADDSLAASSLHQASTLPKLSKASHQSSKQLRPAHLPQDLAAKAIFLDGSTAVDNASAISDKVPTQPRSGAPANELNRRNRNRDRSTASKWNFNEMRKHEALYTVDKQTIKNLKDDPVLLERIIRNNRAAEINHFVSIVKKKAEKDEAEVTSMPKVSPETFDTYLFTSDKNIRSSLNKYKVPSAHQSAQVAAKYKQGLEAASHKYHPRYAQHASRSVNHLPDHALPRRSDRDSDHVVDYHRRIANSLHKKEDSLNHSASGMLHSQISQPADEEPRDSNFNVKKQMHFTNAWRYDGNEEILKLETHMQSFLRKERSKKFIIRVPLDAKVQNKHLNDYYLVRRKQKLPPPVEVVVAPQVEEFVPKKVRLSHRSGRRKSASWSSSLLGRDSFRPKPRKKKRRLCSPSRKTPASRARPSASGSRKARTARATHRSRRTRACTRGPTRRRPTSSPRPGTWSTCPSPSQWQTPHC